MMCTTYELFIEKRIKINTDLWVHAQRYFDNNNSRDKSIEMVVQYRGCLDSSNKSTQIN